MIVAGVVTSGQLPLVAGSVYQFQCGAKQNGGWWDLTGAVVTLRIKDPTGTITSYTTTIAAGVPLSQKITLSAIAGTWTWSWTVVAGGDTFISRPRGFNVIASP
jgi:hypothetical protein